MITKTIHQFLLAVDWGELDYLLVDLPPGTGDAQLSLCQTVPLDGGVIITTPQEASLGVVRKGIAMFRKVNVPILGLVENMSYFTTPNGERVEIFGHGGGQEEAARQNAPFLGEIPIFTEIREAGDRGTPVVVSAPNHPAGRGVYPNCGSAAEKTGVNWSMAEIDANSRMGEVLEQYPGAQRALFRKYHIGGCSSCGFSPDETLGQVCARNGGLNVAEVLAHIQSSHEQDAKVLISPAELAALMQTDPAVKLVDVRSREEFEAVHIAGSVLLSQDAMREIMAQRVQHASACGD